VYEPPFILDDSHAPDDPDFTEKLRSLVAGGHRTRAVKAFFRLMGVPALVVAVMPVLPVWKKVTACADTLPNDFEIVSPYRRGRALPADHYASISVPVLLIAGGKSPTYMQQAPTAIAAQVPDAQTAVLEGQTHEVKAEVIAPVLARHFLKA
jgi:pimeloyl-ACP methyl ester carboxylesterase